MIQKHKEGVVSGDMSSVGLRAKFSPKCQWATGQESDLNK